MAAAFIGSNGVLYRPPSRRTGPSAICRSCFLVSSRAASAWIHARWNIACGSPPRAARSYQDCARAVSPLRDQTWPMTRMRVTQVSPDLASEHCHSSIASVIQGNAKNAPLPRRSKQTTPIRGFRILLHPRKVAEQSWQEALDVTLSGASVDTRDRPRKSAGANRFLQRLRTRGRHPRPGSLARYWMRRSISDISPDDTVVSRPWL